MQFETTHDLVRSVAQDIVIFGGSIMAIAYGLRRVYRMARNVETLLETSAKDANERKTISDNLAAHIAQEEARDARMDETVRALMNGQNEILREIRPNGGSSIKDVVNSVQRDVAVLKQWKEDTQGQWA